MPTTKLSELTSPAFARWRRRGRGAIVPFGSVEAHGPHLPLATDACQVEAVAERVAAKTGFLLAPLVPYGVCLSTRDHPGTVGITGATLRSLALDLVASFRRQGVTTLLFITGHAGQTHVQALREALEEALLADPALRIALISEYDLLLRVAGDLLEAEDDRHAGEAETSRMLHLRPGLVKGSAPAGRPSGSPEVLAADKVGRWPGSVWGDPGPASAAKGRLLLERSVKEVCRIIGELSD